jgi:hypothetical protein
VVEAQVVTLLVEEVLPVLEVLVVEVLVDNQLQQQEQIILEEVEVELVRETAFYAQAHLEDQVLLFSNTHLVMLQIKHLFLQTRASSEFQMVLQRLIIC